VLEELACLDAAAELVVAEEPVLAPVDLGGTLRPRRRGDGDLELGQPLDERADERPLARSRGPGDDEDRQRQALTG
jgi:hypothetical protein